MKALTWESEDLLWGSTVLRYDGILCSVSNIYTYIMRQGMTFMMTLLLIGFDLPPPNF